MGRGRYIPAKQRYIFSMVSLLCLLTAAAMLILGDNYFNWFLSIPCYFLFTGTLYYFMAGKIISAPGSKFMAYYMGMMFIKLMVAVTGIALYLLFIKEQKMAFVIGFFVYYIAFSILETMTLLKMNKEVNSEK